MKKIFLSFFYACAISSFAQPTITQAQFPMAVGDIVTTYGQSTYIGCTEGPGQTWDYTGLDISAPLTLNVINPGASGITGLPASTLCNNFMGSVECFFIDSTGMQRTGFGGSTENFPYQDPQDIFNFPISYGNNLVDSFYSNYVTNGFNGIRRGTVTMNVTGYGTLLLPNSVTLNNVLQLKLHEITIDSTDVSGEWQIVTFDMNTYQFYAQNYHGNIVTMTSGIVTLVGSSTDTISGGRYNMLASGAGIESHDISAHLDLYPVPADDHVMLSNRGSIDPTGFTYSIVNIYGQVVQTGIITNDNLSFDISMLSSGLYVFNINGGNFKASKKFIKS
jgi:hypothetical protein